MYGESVHLFSLNQNDNVTECGKNPSNIALNTEAIRPLNKRLARTECCLFSAFISFRHGTIGVGSCVSTTANKTTQTQTNIKKFYICTAI